MSLFRKVTVSLSEVRQDINRLSPFFVALNVAVSRPCRQSEFTPFRALCIGPCDDLGGEGSSWMDILSFSNLSGFRLPSCANFLSACMGIRVDSTRGEGHTSPMKNYKNIGICLWCSLASFTGVKRWNFSRATRLRELVNNAYNLARYHGFLYLTMYFLGGGGRLQGVGVSTLWRIP